MYPNQPGTGGHHNFRQTAGSHMMYYSGPPNHHRHLPSGFLYADEDEDDFNNDEDNEDNDDEDNDAHQDYTHDDDDADNDHRRFRLEHAHHRRHERRHNLSSTMSLNKKNKKQNQSDANYNNDDDHINDNEDDDSPTITCNKNRKRRTNPTTSKTLNVPKKKKRTQPATLTRHSHWFDSSSSSSSSVDSGAGGWDPEIEDEDDSEDDRVLQQIKIQKAAIHKTKKKKSNFPTPSSSVSSSSRKKKKFASRRCSFIDDEALESKDEDNDDDGDSNMEEDNEQYQSAHEDEKGDEVAEQDDDHNDGDHDFANVDDNNSVSEESVVTKITKPNQQVYPALFESSEDESVNSITASQSSDDGVSTLHTQTSSVLASGVLPPTTITKPKTLLYDCPIITSFPRPSYSKERIQEFNYTCETAPCHRDAVITYETMGEDVVLKKEPLESNGIKQLHSFVKEGRGLLWHNRTSAKLHYETSMSTYKDSVVRKASQAGIPHRLFHSNYTELQSVVEGPNIFLFQSGTFENFHDKVCFEDLIRDACIPARHTVPKMDSVRENSGPSVGLSTSQGLTRARNESFAVPGWVGGTHRYMKVFGVISTTTKSLLDSANLSDRLPATDSSASPKQKFYNERCQDLCEDNLYLSLSFKIYLHQPKNVQNHDGHFRAHRDLQNPDRDSPNDFMFCAWDTWFEPLLNLNVTGTIIACGRRSQEELFERMLRIETATAHLLSCSALLPTGEKEIDASSLCPDGVEFIVKGSHLLQIHALTPNHYLHELYLKLGKNGGLSAYLAVEVILAFHQTSNNALRFHRFMTDLLGKVHTNDDLRGYVGDLNVVECFQKYCYEEYGGYEGVTNRLSQQEGIVRHQSSVSCPVSLHANQQSMRSLVRTLALFSSGPFNNTRYVQLLKQVKQDVIFLGELKAQKAIMNFASIGLFIPQNYLEYFATGSRSQQLKNLKRFGLQSSDDVAQLRRHLVCKLDILPMQADEYICSLAGLEPNATSLSKRAGGEIFYRDNMVHCAERTPDGFVQVKYFSPKRNRLVPAPNILFNYKKDDSNHYLPTWAKHADLHGNTFISLSSTVNLEHSGTLKKSTALNFLQSRRIVASDLQPMLMSGNYVIVSDLLSEAADHFDSTVELVSKSLAVYRGRNWKGCSAAIDYKKFTQSTSPPEFQPEQLRAYNDPSRLSRFMSCGVSPGTYETSHSAKCAALLHFLLNIGVVHKPHGWASKYFPSVDSRGAEVRGVLLLVPNSSLETESLCVATAFLYVQKRNGNKIMCSMITEDGTGDEPFECARVNDQKE